MSPCASPISHQTLVALWTGELSEEEAGPLEEHLFECDPCSEASRRLGLLITEIRAHLPGILTHAHRARLADAGMRIHNTEVRAGIDARAFFAPDIDLLVHVLHADLAGVDRVDLELVLGEGPPVIAFEDVPFDPVSGEVLVACQRHFQAMFPTIDPTMRVIAHKGDTRWQVGLYFVRHEWPSP